MVGSELTPPIDMTAGLRSGPLYSTKFLQGGALPGQAGKVTNKFEVRRLSPPPSTCGRQVALRRVSVRVITPFSSRTR